ncbi:endonuclease/exonuclease/phosphatase family protein [Tepidimonas charontis]|uniref:Endonuclease/Exonuclease/phosphatase family protein n=1 Tax=Tepidimonas charontis TaxID=2267262 RepID=A0A554XIV8_9BURK|nr:endonuclease/exonuclease/phosphatase family protein [Tepidimonas charontis]TSE35755.1 Endonuclease/Exonuclease/phosphatase family protein [Tepidimonas charontis]
MRILTWNVQWFRGMDDVVDVRRVLAHAMDWGGQPEVLCLQEVAQHMPGLAGAGEADQVAAVAAALPGYEVFYAPAVDDWRPGRAARQRFGNLIASRLPVWQAQHRVLPYPPDASVPSMPRALAAVTVQAPWGPLRVGCTHLAYYSARQRVAQAQALCDWQREAAAVAAQPPRADAEDGPDTPFQLRVHTVDALLCGDFNSPPGGDAWRVLAGVDAPPAVFHDTWTLVHGPEPQPPTFRVHETGAVPLACDFIWVTPGLAARVLGVRVDGATTLSDHQPVCVELSNDGPVRVMR